MSGKESKTPPDRIGVEAASGRVITNREGVSEMIVQHALPKINRFLKPIGLPSRSLGLVVRCVAAFCLHWGRMSASQAAGAVRSEPRHRAQIGRFLSRKALRKRPMLSPLQAQLLTLEPAQGRYLFLIDQTLSSQQGDKTENTYSTGNRRRRPRKGVRYNTYKHARKRCHCFVMGLLLTPSGVRIPFRRCYYTKEYCALKGMEYRKQPELAAELIRELPLPDGADVIVLGDTAFDAKVIRQACDERKYSWVVPMNPERVLAGEKPRPKVRSLAKELWTGQFQAIRLHPNQGPYTALRRRSVYRVGPKTKPRVYYAHAKIRDVLSVGKVRLVFSTWEKPHAGGRPEVQKILMSNNLALGVSELVELYELRWQIEQFFKELKSTLGFDQYRFRRFEAVQGWLEMTLVTFLYLEWHRVQKLRQSGLPAREKARWRYQRTHGLCVAMRRESERADLKYLVEALRTPGGIRRLQKQLDQATPAEFRTVA
jgi:IS4 transposase